MRWSVVDEAAKYRQDYSSTPTFALLNDANPTRVQKMMDHKHYATTEIYVEEVQKLLEKAKEAVTQI